MQISKYLWCGSWFSQDIYGFVSPSGLFDFKNKVCYVFSKIHSLPVWLHQSAIQIVKRFLTKKDKIRRYLQRIKQNLHRQLILNALQIVFVLFGSKS